MKYPKEYLDEIKSRLKVSSVVSKSVSLKKRGKEFVGLSPFKNEKTPSFTVNDGQIKSHYGKPAEEKEIVPKITCDQVMNHLENCLECRQKIALMMNPNMNVSNQLQEMQQKINNLEQKAGSRFDIVAFAEENPLLTIIIILVGIDLFTKAFLK